MSRIKAAKIPVGKQLKEFRQQLEILRRQFQQFNLKMVEHHKMFDERSMTAWEYLWSVVEALRIEGQLEWLTEEKIDHFRKIVLERWKDQALTNLKDRLGVGAGICERCHHTAGGPEFFKDEEEKSRCPNCGAEDSVFLKNVKEVA